jgi:hypothetical protein
MFVAWIAACNCLKYAGELQIRDDRDEQLLLYITFSHQN